MKNIKHILLATLLIAAATLSAQLKGNKLDNEKRQELEAQKVAFITEKVGLTTEEAEQFWKLYNEFKKQMCDLNKQEKEVHRRVNENTTELEYSEINKELSLISEKKQRLRQAYNEKYLHVLSAKKLYQFYKAEESYKKLLLNKLQKSIPLGEQKSK